MGDPSIKWVNWPQQPNYYNQILYIFCWDEHWALLWHEACVRMIIGDPFQTYKHVPPFHSGARTWNSPSNSTAFQTWHFLRAGYQSVFPVCSVSYIVRARKQSTTSMCAPQAWLYHISEAHCCRRLHSPKLLHSSLWCQIGPMISFSYVFILTFWLLFK